MYIPVILGYFRLIRKVSSCRFSCERVLHRFLEIATGSVRQLCHSANSSYTPDREPLYRRWEGLIDWHTQSLILFPPPTQCITVRCGSSWTPETQKKKKKIKNLLENLNWKRKIVLESTQNKWSAGYPFSLFHWIQHKLFMSSVWTMCQKRIKFIIKCCLLRFSLCV